MKTCQLVLLPFILILTAGCGVKQRDPGSIRYFLLDVQRSASASPLETNACLRVRPCRVASSFDTLSLVYRTAPVRYEQDYYNRFLTTPHNQITDALQSWFRQTGLSDCGLSDEPNLRKFTLEPSVDVLCADFSDADNPVAVVQMHVLLTRFDSDCACIKIALENTFTQQTPLPQKPTAAQVVEGLSRSLTHVLNQLEDEIARLL